MSILQQQVEKQRQLEASVLGTIMKCNYLLDDSGIQTDYFTLGAHQALFETFKQLKVNNKPIDIATVLTTNVNGSIDANELMFISNAGNERNFDAHVQLLFEQYRERQKEAILKESLQEDKSINDIIKELQSIESNKVDDYHNIKDLLAEVVESPFQPQQEIMSHKTGFRLFDAISGGLRNSELIIIAARPSVGKTALALNFMRSMTQANNNIIPIFFSVEMSAELNRNRLIASVGGYDSRKLDNPYAKLTDEEKTRWAQVLAAVRAINLEMFDSANQSISDMRRKIRKMAHLHKGKQLVVFIDYLQIIKGESRNMSEYERITTVSKGLKGLAREFDIPVVCLSQLNRGNEQRQEKRPSMSDLRGSGSIEQDADIIALLHREDYYEPNPMNHNHELEINISKNRNAATGVVTLHFDKATQTIMDKG